MAARLIGAAGVVSVIVTACIVDVDFGATRFKCTDSPECPTGQECVNGYCEAPGEDDAAVDDAAPIDALVLPDAAPPPPDHRIGNLLTYTFDGVAGGIVIDESGNRFDGDTNGANSLALESIYGDARDFDGGDVAVPKHPPLVAGPPITIEAWVRRDTNTTLDVVFSDRDPLTTPYATYDLTLQPTPGGTTFSTNDGCADTEVSVTSTATEIPAGVWAHLAVTWDGESVKLYVDGSRTDTLELIARPCAAPGRRFGIAERPDDTGAFRGEIDEFKLSDYVKTNSQIAESMSFDTAAAAPVCGDHHMEGAESCDLESICCNAAACQYATNGSACGTGTCQSGVCVAGGGRVTEGLVALYEFDDGAGTTVADTSGVAPELDLVIGDALAVTWGTGTLTVDTTTLIASTVPAAKIVTACQLTNELTLEAWVVPANVTQTGPARLVTMSIDTALRNFQLGQAATRYQLRARSALSDDNAAPYLSSPAGDAATVLTHVVATRDANGDRVLYVNGTPRDTNHVEGDFGNWDSTYGLALANEFTNDRTWLGTYHLVAIYGRSLSAEEVGRNFTAGPD